MKGNCVRSEVGYCEVEKTGICGFDFGFSGFLGAGERCEANKTRKVKKKWGGGDILGMDVFVYDRRSIRLRRKDFQDQMD